MTKRDIKFREWDPVRQELYGNGLVYMEREDYDMSVCFATEHNEIDDVENRVLEQYTEVKDINGVEFYDNDIVRVEVSQLFESEELGGRLSVIGVVKYDEGAYWVDWGTGRTRLWSETLQMTVLGNIHENLELLEV